MEYTINDLKNGAIDIARSVFGKKSEYQLQFNHEEDGLWYIDYPNWKFEHHNLLMVEGADKLCAFLSDNNKVTKVLVRPSKTKHTHSGYFELERLKHSLTGGATYQVNDLEGFTDNIWICPVTLFVLGEYPKYIYVKKS